MSNLALYRKYRSKDFDELVGQEHIVRALDSAIKDGRHNHAYLLTGPRGVGKTTVARIIAKNINGLKKDSNLKDHIDILEIDGASNRGIDEVRSLREKIQISPSKLNYKVYIIDEVHMLTKEAFNALLKTLEEPPSHVVFIFATTEANKLPETIISRTQRFDFRPISSDLIVKHLKNIADKENIKVDDESLNLISKISRGGFRDAISLLDQLSAIDKSIDSSLVIDFTGLQNQETINQIISYAISKDSDNLIKLLHNLYDSGADPVLLSQQILDNVYDMIRSGSDYALDSMVELSENVHWIQSNIKSSSLPQLTLQIGLIRKTFGTNNSIQPIEGGLLNEDNKAKKVKVSNKDKNSIKSSTIEADRSRPSKDSEDNLLKALSLIKRHNNSLYALLRGASIEVDETEIYINCRFSFHKERVSEHQNTKLIEKAFSKVYGRDLKALARVDEAIKKENTSKDDELLKSAVAILGGSVIDE